jgi:hypothetical protein
MMTTSSADRQSRIGCASRARRCASALADRSIGVVSPTSSADRI